jgi:hypothetical protein
MDAALYRVEGAAMKQTEYKESKAWMHEEQQKRRRIAKMLFLLAVLSLAVFIIFRILFDRIP